MIVQEYSDTERGQLVVNRHYDGRGLLVSESAPRKGICLLGNFSERLWRNNRGFKSSRTYDTLRRPVLVTLPDGETTEHRYAGWSRSLVDQNDHLKRWDSDGLGRMTKVSEYTGSDPTSVALYAETTYAYNVTDELTKVTDAAGNLTTISYDDLGRKISMTDPDMGSWSYTYDAVGNLIEQTDAKSQVIEFAYDKLNRLVRKWYPPAWTNSVGFTVYDLIEFRAAVDAERAAAGLSTGGWTDPEASSIRAAHLTELRSRLQGLWTAASLGAVPQFTAGDSAAPSRQVAATDLADLRGWLYDSNNTSYETSTWAGSRRARTLYEYDGIGEAAGKGRRTAMWDACGNSSWSYDEYGRTTTATRVVDGRSYASDYTFDALDRVREMTYPDGEALTYSYQANLLLDGIQSSIDSLDIVSDVVYEDIGLPDSYTLGGGATTATQSFEYWKIDDASRSPFAALKRIKLSKDSTDLVNREMQYDAVGNVTKIVDGVNSETIDYTYDELNRVLTASVPAGESFAYDTIGNMTSKAGAALDYGTTSPKHAVKSHGTTTYTYDANGSLTAKGTQTIKYDPEQRPILVQDGSNYSRAAYDGDGVRRKRMDSNGTVHYLGGYERKLAADSNSSDTVTKYYSASLGALSRPVAFRRGGTLHWVGADHLGGTIRVLDGSFTALDGMRYKPYGEDRDTGSSLNTDRKFTGQTQDEAAGLYWYASRAYDPAIGRFVSPDSIVPAPANPQSLNRYSYVRNNPLKFVDPTGQTREQEGWDSDWADEFVENHHGRRPRVADWEARQHSLLHPGSGPDGSWTDQDWVDHYYRQAANQPTTNARATFFVGAAGQGGRFDHLSESEQAAIQFNIPVGVDLEENIRISEAGPSAVLPITLGRLPLEPSSNVPFAVASIAVAYGPWLERILPYSEWDYKRRLDDHEVYQDFGNFNFGMTGAAEGIPLQALLQGAGLLQSVMDAGYRRPGPANPTEHGDHPRDEAMIKLGHEFYRDNRICGHIVQDGEVIASPTLMVVLDLLIAASYAPVIRWERCYFFDDG